MRTRISKRAFIGMAGALIWLTTVSTSAHALLGSQSSLTANRIIVGTANLLISNSQAGSSTAYEHSREGFALNLAPGQMAERYFLLKNTSSADIAMGIQVSAAVAQDLGNMAPSLRFEFTPVDSSGAVLDGMTPARATLSNLGTNLAINGTIPKGAYQRYKMSVTLDMQYNLPVQDLSYDLVFSGTQVAG